MKTKTKISLIVIILLIVTLFSWYAFAPYIDAYRANINLEISGVKLLMTASDAEKILGKGNPIDGFGGSLYRYDNAGITIAYPSDGLLKNKVGWIEISDTKYNIYGIQVGDAFEKSKIVLEKHGFRQDQIDKNSFQRGSTRISIYGQSIRINIEDWTLRGRVY